MDKETWSDIIKNGAYSYELDWIAIDTKGQIGVFSAIMNAPIPREIGKSCDLYSQLQSIVNQLNDNGSALRCTSDNGDFTDWDEYARKGIYAYDFQDIHRKEKEKLAQYDLISKPSNPRSINELGLTNELNSIIPIIDFDFGVGDMPIKKIKTHYNNK